MKPQRKSSFIYGSIPHSVLRRVQEIKNPTASSLLLHLATRTFAFRKGHADRTYRQLAKEIGVSWRSIATAAQKLQDWGDLIRARHNDGSYRWWIPLEAKEIVEDPEHAFAVRQSPVSPDPHDRSIMGGHDQPCMGGMIDRSWGQRDVNGSLTPDQTKARVPSEDPQKETLKKLFKEKDLKKQHHAPAPGVLPTIAHGELGSALEPQLAVCKTDDESSHKDLIKTMIDLGVSRRKARQLCRENSHDLIRRVLKTAPNRPGIENLAGYIVTEITDGGYEQAFEQKKAPGLTTSLGHYAHLTNNKLNDGRHRNVRSVSDSPKASPSVEQTRQEQQRLEEERRRGQEIYDNDVRILIDRFKNLPAHEKNGLTESARKYLESMLPNSRNRAKMAADKTFRQMAMKTVVERFFQLVDDGLTGLQALRSPLLLGA